MRGIIAPKTSFVDIVHDGLCALIVLARVGWRSGVTKVPLRLSLALGNNHCAPDPAEMSIMALKLGLTEDGTQT